MILSGVRVLEVGGFATGPFATMLLGDLGAEVIKVERPGIGDPWRKLDADVPNKPTLTAHNRNKKSIQIDISMPEGREVFLRIASKSQVIVENLRAGAMSDLGLGFNDVVKVNPRIVYCSASCFGPYSSRPGYDTIAQGISGLLSLLTDMKNPEIRGPHFGDLLGGMFAAYGVLAGLIEVGKSGKAIQVDVSMIGSSMAFASVSILNNIASRGKESAKSRIHRSQGYAFLTKDSPIVVHLSTPEKFWQNLLEVTGLQRLREDERFKTSTSRYTYYEEIRKIMQPVFLTKTRAEWLKLLQERDVPCGALNSVGDVLDDEDVVRLGIIRWTNGTPHVANPVEFSGHERITNNPPAAGQNTREILEAMGYSKQEADSIILKSGHAKSEAE